MSGGSTVFIHGWPGVEVLCNDKLTQQFLFIDKADH